MVVWADDMRLVMVVMERTVVSKKHGCHQLVSQLILIKTNSLFSFVICSIFGTGQRTENDWLQVRVGVVFVAGKMKYHYNPSYDDKVSIFHTT